MTALRILLAEDEALLRELTSEDLRDAGHWVACAEDGDMALKVLEQESFDLLLTDIRMPGTLDGWELARTARALARDQGRLSEWLFPRGAATRRRRPLPQETLPAG
jgi:CheY-like chemotaxis protein